MEKRVRFWKYEGTGNDFIMLDGREPMGLNFNPQEVSSLCDRHKGIGADGLIVLEKESRNPSVFKMIYYNSDGRQSTMCGNGGRCFVRFASDLGLLNQNEMNFMAVDGSHYADIDNDGRIHLHMIDVNKGIQQWGGIFYNTGSPHLVVPCQDLEVLSLVERARAIRYHETYAAEGVNVNFVLFDPENQQVNVRTYERGVEGETLSCGTGAVATALYATEFYGLSAPIAVHYPGGKLEVSFKTIQAGYREVILSGPARKVFEGYYFLE